MAGIILLFFVTSGFLMQIRVTIYPSPLRSRKRLEMGMYFHIVFSGIIQNFSPYCYDVKRTIICVLIYMVSLNSKFYPPTMQRSHNIPSLWSPLAKPQLKLNSTPIELG